MLLSDTSKNRDNWNHLKNHFKKKPEQYTGEAKIQGTTENGHIGLCAHTSGSTNLKYKAFNMGSNSGFGGLGVAC